MQCCWHSYQLITNWNSKRSEHPFHASQVEPVGTHDYAVLGGSERGSQTGGSLAPPEYTKHSHTWTLLTLSSLAADGTRSHTHTRGPKVTHTQTGMQSILVIGQSAGNCLHCWCLFRPKLLTLELLFFNIYIQLGSDWMCVCRLMFPREDVTGS